VTLDEPKDVGPRDRDPCRPMPISAKNSWLRAHLSTIYEIIDEASQCGQEARIVVQTRARARNFNTIGSKASAVQISRAVVEVERYSGKDSRAVQKCRMRVTMGQITGEADRVSGPPGLARARLPGATRTAHRADNLDIGDDSFAGPGENPPAITFVLTQGTQFELMAPRAAVNRPPSTETITVTPADRCAGQWPRGILRCCW